MGREPFAGCPGKGLPHNHAQIWKADDTGVVVAAPVDVAMRQVVRVVIIGIYVDPIRPVIENLRHPSATSPRINIAVALRGSDMKVICSSWEIWISRSAPLS